LCEEELGKSPLFVVSKLGTVRVLYFIFLLHVIFMGKSKSSDRWLREHFSDPLVQKAKKEGYRSRASYKLIELDDKDRFIRTGNTVLDLGAAPGGWSQVAADRVGSKGLVIASDILEMDSLGSVDFIQGDFTEEEVYQRIIGALKGEKADLVISDMAPNMSGNKAIDQPKAMYLAELAIDMVFQVLKSDGVFVTKLFMGEGFDQYIKDAKGRFNRVLTRKPSASRSRSNEVYMIAMGLR